MSLYTQIEKHLFFTLTRKIVGNIGFLVLFIYAVPVDKKRLPPAHHSHLSKPMTGNFETDNVNSRHLKIYNTNRAEIRRAANTEPFLLQTYIRDTGEVLNDLSFPLYINGKHWGAFILGFKPEQLLERD